MKKGKYLEAPISEGFKKITFLKCAENFKETVIHEGRF